MSDKNEQPVAQQETNRPTSFFLKEKVIPVKNIFEAISPRITDDNGVPVIFEFKALSASKISELETMNQKAIKNKNKQVIGRELDAEAYTMAIAIESCVYPDFRNAELIKSWGVKTAKDLVDAMLFIDGERNRFAKAAFRVNEMGSDFESLVDEAKN